MSAAGVRAVPLRSSAVNVARRADGSILLTTPEPLAAHPTRLTQRFAEWVDRAPERVFIGQRDAQGNWRTLTYAEAFRRFQRIGAALLQRDLSIKRPIAILSDNDVEHALLALAAMHAGIPYVPISSAYSLISNDLAKLRYVFELMTPGLVFASDATKLARAISDVVPADTEVIATNGSVTGRRITPFADLEREQPIDAVGRAFSATGPDTVAKFLLTSGSTGNPKAVINTQRMLCSNQQMILQSLPALADAPPVLVDWLPWNHTFGGNHNFGLTIWNGGSLYIDEGKPVPALFGRSVENLRSIAPTVYFNVPRGFEELVPHLRRDAELRTNFFSQLKLLFYAGAGLAQPVWDAMDELAVQTCGRRVLWVTGLGATETAPSITFTTRDGVRSGMIGTPVPGVEVKLTPEGDKLECRVRGPSITPGYWRQPELTRAARDEEGYHRMGDAVRFVDPSDPTFGLVFDGRVAEDFKLATGTWVSVGPLRARVIAAGAPYVQDVVIAGLNRDTVGALIIPNVEACRALCPELPHTAAGSTVLQHTAVRTQFQKLLDEFAKQATGSATRIVRAIVLTTPPSIDASEITDKGSINQRAMLASRAAEVEALYEVNPPERVLVAGQR